MTEAMTKSAPLHSMIKIAITDDRDEVRKYLTQLLKTQNDFDVVIQAKNYAHLSEQLKLIKSDVIVINLRMINSDLMLVSEQIREFYPQTKIFTFTQNDIDLNTRIIDNNYNANLSVKHVELINGIRTLIYSGIYLTEGAWFYILRTLIRGGNQPTNISLNPDEKILLDSLCRGYSSNKIGAMICKSPRTVEKYRQALYEKFGAKNKEQLILNASRQQFV